MERGEEYVDMRIQVELLGYGYKLGPRDYISIPHLPTREERKEGKLRYT